MSDYLEDGGPAFPLCRTEEGGRNDCLHTGMSLRDWFAGRALQGLLSSSRALNGKNTFSQDDLSKASYDMADTMIRERMKPRPS